MPADYIITGAASPLGRHILEKLMARQCRIVGIDSPDSAAGAEPGFPLVTADVRDSQALRDIFRAEAREYTVVIHAAERVNFSSEPDREMFAINYGGTKNVLDACMQQPVRRLVYVGSALTLPAPANGGFVREDADGNRAVPGDAYAKSKAAAGEAVAEALSQGLDCVTVLPSALIGCGAEGSLLDQLLCGLTRGSVRFGVTGGTDMADVRDVAQGVVLAADKGICGRSYILSGRFVTMRELYDIVRREGSRVPRLFLPYAAAKALARLVREWDGERPLFNEGTLSLLHRGTHYSHERAARELGYAPHQTRGCIADAVQQYRPAPARVCLPPAAAQA